MILQGDALTVLKTLPDESVNMCVTSPPYYGLRQYLPDGSENEDKEIGREEAPEAYIERLVAVFHEVKRVLRNDGTLWVNIGDSYAAQRSGTYQPAETLAGGEHGKTKDGEIVNRGRCSGYNPTRNAAAIGLKHKDLIGIPWMLAFALRTDGWYLRQDIIWEKSNPMPESVKDRCTKSHEYIFLLSKSSNYFFDHSAMQEPACDSRVVERKENPPRYGGKKYSETPEKFHRTKSGNAYAYTGFRNKRDVWRVSTVPYAGAHFATFPEKLIEPCILAGTSNGGVVLDCFSGAGTTGVVCAKLGRKYIGIELNPEYVKLSEDRIAAVEEEIWRENAQYSLWGDEA